MSYIGKYIVPVITPQQTEVHAVLEPANKQDAETPYFTTFNWPYVWTVNVISEWDGVVKLTYQDKILGLVRYSIIPTEEPDDECFVYEKQPGLVLVGNLEAAKDIEHRLVDPVGKWLMWYVAQVALTYCDGNEKGYVVALVAKPDACDYYRNKIGMNHELPTTENVFTFSKQGAEQFCGHLIEQYGAPISTDSDS